LAAMHITLLSLPTFVPKQKPSKAAKKDEKTVNARITEVVPVDNHTRTDEPASFGNDVILDWTTFHCKAATVEDPSKSKDSIESSKLINKTLVSDISVETSLEIPPTVDDLTETSSAQATLHASEDNLFLFNANRPSTAMPFLSRSPLKPQAPHESPHRKTEIARNTFLGTTSLEHFVETLDFERLDGITAKEDICEAFASLAGASMFGLDRVRTQRKVKLGQHIAVRVL